MVTLRQMRRPIPSLPPPPVSCLVAFQVAGRVVAKTGRIGSDRDATWEPGDVNIITGLSVASQVHVRRPDPGADVCFGAQCWLQPEFKVAR